MNGQPFAAIQLEQAKRRMRQLQEELPALRSELDAWYEQKRSKAKEVFDELCTGLRSLPEALETAQVSLSEMGMEEHAALCGKLISSVSRFQPLSKDYSKLAAAIGLVLSRLPDLQDEKVNAAIVGRLMNHIKLGYYPTDQEHIRLFVRGIAFPGCTTNLFDPCCGCGLALRQLAAGNNCYTFGCELDSQRAQEAQERLHRVGFGSFFHSRTSAESFHLLFLNPPYLPIAQEGGGNVRSEQRFLVESYPHLLMGGLLIYILPYYRLDRAIARVLCDNFTDLSAYRFMGREFERFHQIAVLGIRRPRSDGSAHVDGLLQQAQAVSQLPTLDNLPENRYPLPDTPKEVRLFKGAEFNVTELARQFKESKSLCPLLEESDLERSGKRPLLPLSIGQVGLIGGSGLINGLVECDSPHIIKGRIIKEARRDSTPFRNREGELMYTTVTETYSNKMVFNLLTAGGFQSLT